MSDVTLIDYGAGNLASLSAGLRRLGASTRVTSDPAEVTAARRLVLPGVGAAAPAMAQLRARGLDRAIDEAVADGAALLGICLGLQLLFDQSAEGDTPCLGLIEGRSVAIDWSQRLPHMGWNDVRATNGHALAEPLPAVCYFAHSYVVEPADARTAVAETDLDGTSFTCLASSGRVAGAQFHPEKSGAGGRAFLERWIEWADAA